MKQEMDGKVVYFPPFDFDVIMYKVLFVICTLTRQVNNYVYRQENV